MSGKLRAIWHRLPVVVRAPLIAYVVPIIGSTLALVPLVGHTKFLRSVPWALPGTLAFMWASWRCATGSGYPAATRDYRVAMTREKAIPARVRRAAIPAVVASLVTSCSLRLILPSSVIGECGWMNGASPTGSGCRGAA